MPRKAPLHEANGSSNVLIGIPVMPFEQRWHILVGYIELSPQLFFFGPGFGRNHTMIYIQMVPWVVVIIYSNLCSLYAMWVKQGEGASKRPCVSAHGYISIQWCSKVSPQRERFFTDIYILWVCQKSWKGMEKWESRCDFTGFCGTKAIMLEKAAVRFFFSLFQPLLRQRSPRHLYMSSWQFLRTYI